MAKLPAKAAAKAAPKKAAPKVSLYDQIEAAVLELDEKFKRTKKETTNDYLARILVLLGELPEDDFAALPEPVQEWQAEAATAYNAEEEIPVPDGYDDPEAAAPEEEPEEEPEVAPKKGAAKKAPAPAAKPTSKKAPVEEEESEEETEEDPTPAKKPFGGKQAAPFTAKPDGVTFQLRLLIAKNPDISVEDLKKQMEKKGHAVKTSTASTIRGDMLATIRALKEAGRFK